jgi:hypothetical protein
VACCASCSASARRVIARSNLVAISVSLSRSFVPYAYSLA